MRAPLRRGTGTSSRWPSSSRLCNMSCPVHPGQCLRLAPNVRPCRCAHRHPGCDQERYAGGGGSRRVVHVKDVLTGKSSLAALAPALENAFTTVPEVFTRTKRTRAYTGHLSRHVAVVGDPDGSLTHARTRNSCPSSGSRRRTSRGSPRRSICRSGRAHHRESMSKFLRAV